MRADAGRPLQSLRACSACAGEYEDPERAEPRVDEENEDAPAAPQATAGKAERDGAPEFPVRKD